MKIALFILSIFLISCSNQTQEKPSADAQTNNSTITQKINLTDTINTVQQETIISKRFLQFAKFLDSSGYSCDTVRLNKTYGVGHSNRLVIENYYFYNYPLKKSSLELYYEDLKNDSDLLPERLNSKTFERATSIVSFFFTQKNHTDWCIDGRAEEWKFPDEHSAKIAATELGDKANQIYFNTGAFVCYVDNYMYVFTSRASGFMYSIKPLFNKFTIDNNLIVTNRGTYL